jgi:hypothetical protein
MNILGHALVFGALLMACNNEDGTPPPPPPSSESPAQDSGTSGAPFVTRAGGTSTSCNAIVNAADETTSRTIAGEHLPATGGPVADGTYLQRELNLYDPNGSSTAPKSTGMRATLVIAGGLMNGVMETTLDGDHIVTYTATFTTSGTAMNRTVTCPEPGKKLDAVYSIDGDTLTVYDKSSEPSSSIVAASVYVKQ